MLLFLASALLLISTVALLALALKAANLEGQLTQSEAKANELSEIAKRAIDCAAEKHFPKPSQRFSEPLPSLDTPLPANYGRYVRSVNAFCPSCNVSVRHEAHEYPVHCPACNTLIDPTFDNPPSDF